MNPFLASIFIAGIVAAGMSTIDGILGHRPPVLLPVIFIRKIINKNATDEAVMSLSKVLTVIIRYRCNLLWCIPARQYF